MLSRDEEGFASILVASMWEFRRAFLRLLPAELGKGHIQYPVQRGTMKHSLPPLGSCAIPST